MRGATYLIPGPELQMIQDLADHLPFNNKADDLHLRLAVGTNQGVDFPYFFDTFTPEWRWNSARLIILHINHRQLADVYRFSLLLPVTTLPIELTAFATHAV